jgi:hypothetical protein|nr:MAG: hypothetical protein [Bacteriophage sp.]
MLGLRKLDPPLAKAVANLAPNISAPVSKVFHTALPKLLGESLKVLYHPLPAWYPSITREGN